MNNTSFLINSLIVFSILQIRCADGQTIETKDSPGESVYLHTDRSCYNADESILFKAFILNNLSSPPGSGGDILYVALIDQEGLEVASGKFAILNRNSAGSLKLSKYLTDGIYLLIACTGPDKNISPGKIFSEIIEVKGIVNHGADIDIKLKDTLYKPGDLLSANIRFSGKNYEPVSTSFTYMLQNSKGEITRGQGKSKENGSANLEIPLPEFQNKDTLKLTVTVSMKGKKINGGIVIPTPYNIIDSKRYSEIMEPVNESKRLNIKIITDKRQYTKGEKVQADIYVTDNQGNPVVVNLSASASSSFHSSYPLQDDNTITCSNLRDYPEGLSSKWRNIVSEMNEKAGPAIMNSYPTLITGTESIFNPVLRQFFAKCLEIMVQSPGHYYDIQQKNDLKKIKKKQETGHKDRQDGYPSGYRIWDIIQQIKPYQMQGGKIVFSNGGNNSINFQDGALIIIDGIKTGTDADVLNTISVSNIAKINISTNPTDIQRYTGLNNVGVIEIIMKKGSDVIEEGKQMIPVKTATVFWEPDLTTDKSGKASISFFNDTTPYTVILTVEGISTDGLAGYSAVQYSVK